MNAKEKVDKYIESYNNIIKVLDDILEAKEITEGSYELLEEAYTDYNEDFASAKSFLESVKAEKIVEKIEDLGYKKLDADQDSVLNILTKNGVYNSIYKNEDGRILIDIMVE